jgi:hypothetical protein
MAVEATVVSSTEAVCVAPAGARGSIAVEVATSFEGQVLAAAEVSTSSKQFGYGSEVAVVSVTPSVGFAKGGSVLSVVANGLEDGAAAWCKIGTVVVTSRKISGGIVECVSVAGAEGNTTVEVSANGQDFSMASGTMVELVTTMNVSSVSQTAVVSGSVVSLVGSGFSASRGVYCAMGGASVDSAAWAYSKGNVMSSSAVSCTVPARGAGMRVVEVAMAAGGEMSDSGVQVEYVSAGSVSSVWPAVGASGTVVTVAGSGFVAGRTACKFGSAMAVEATVMSSTEAVCVAPAGARGSIAVEMATSFVPGAGSC